MGLTPYKSIIDNLIKAKLFIYKATGLSRTLTTTRIPDLTNNLWQLVEIDASFMIATLEIAVKPRISPGRIARKTD